MKNIIFILAKPAQLCIFKISIISVLQISIILLIQKISS